MVTRGFHRSLWRSAFSVWHYEVGTVTVILVPWPTAVRISNLAPISRALFRMFCNPKPSHFSNRSAEIPFHCLLLEERRLARAIEESRQSVWDWHAARRSGLLP